MTATIHRCGVCGHQSANHLGAEGWGGTGHRAGPRLGFCSLGGCPCNLSQRQVESANPPVEVRTFAESDRGTGRWFA